MKNRFWSKSKKEKTVEEKVAAQVESLRELVEENPELTIIFGVSHKEGGATFVQGSGQDIKKILSKLMDSNDDFAHVLRSAAKSNTSTGKKKRVEIVDLPGGDTALAINKGGIEDITDEEVDDIINTLIREIDKNKDDN